MQASTTYINVQSRSETSEEERKKERKKEREKKEEERKSCLPERKVSPMATLGTSYLTPKIFTKIRQIIQRKNFHLTLEFPLIEGQHPLIHSLMTNDTQYKNREIEYIDHNYSSDASSLWVDPLTVSGVGHTGGEDAELVFSNTGGPPLPWKRAPFSKKEGQTIFDSNKSPTCDTNWICRL